MSLMKFLATLPMSTKKLEKFIMNMNILNIEYVKNQVQYVENNPWKLQ